MSKLNSKHTPILWALALFIFIGMLFARAAKPEWIWLTVALGVTLLAALSGILYIHRQDLQKDKAIRGLSSVTTVVLVICILGLVNFLGTRYPQKIDFTKNKVHTLTDPTVKAIKNLKEPLKLVLFSSPEQTDEFRPLFDNLKGVSPKIEVEYVNAKKEAVRAQAAGLKSELPTLQLTVGAREQLIESPNEEKITNTLIKFTKTTSPTLCVLTSHGERDFLSEGPDGYSMVKEALEKQSYLLKVLDLISAGKIPSECTGLAVIGPNKALFPQEMKLISEYLDQGGRAIIAIDFSVKGTTPETSPEFVKLLIDWGVNLEKALIIDPVSKMFQLDPTLPIVATYAKNHPITAEMQGNAIFPFSRPLTLLPNQGPDLKTSWLVQTTPNSWGESDLPGLIKGGAGFGAGDLRGPLNVAVAIEGQRKGHATPAGAAENAEVKKSRIVVFGTSLIAANQFFRNGNNLDLFANSVSWMLDDEAQISIRKPEAAGGTIGLSEVAAKVIFLVSVFLVPFLLIVAGVVIWQYRKRL
jgi:ABC-type uncharacterized transport system involved in gliding motility auxiliary subunit